MDPSAAQKNGKRESRLLILHPRYDDRNELDEKLDLQFNVVLAKTNGLADKEAIEELVKFSRTNKQAFEACCAGLLYGYLVEADRSQKYYKLLKHVASIDQWFVTLCHVNMLLIELLHKTKPQVRQQFLALFRDLIRDKAPRMDNVIVNFVRFIGTSCCDATETHNLVTGFARMCLDNDEWVKSLKPNASLLPLSILVVSRHLCETGFRGAQDQSRILSTFCELLIRERFLSLMCLGRELLFVLMKLAKGPKFSALWSDLYNNPQKIAPNLAGGISDIVLKSNQGNPFQARIPLLYQKRIENMLKFPTSAVHEHHFEWFNQHLLCPSSVGIRCDIIRILPHIPVENRHAYDLRAMFATSLLNGAPASEQLICKLAFIWDWLYYAPTNPPQPLLSLDVVLSSLRIMINSHPSLASSIVEFLVMTTSTIDPPREALIQSNVMNALKQAEAKFPGVLSYVLDHSNMDVHVREAFRMRFSNSVKLTSPVLDVKSQETPHSPKSASMEPPKFPTPPTSSSSASLRDPRVHKNRAQAVSNAAAAVHSHAPPEKAKKTKTAVDSPAEPSTSTATNCADDNEMEDGSDDALAPDGADTSSASSEELENVEQYVVAIADENIREYIEELDTAIKSGEGSAVEIFNKLLYGICEKSDNVDEDQLELIAQCLLTVFEPFLSKHQFIPKDTSEDSVKEIISNTPFYALFRLLCLFTDQDRNQLPLLPLMHQMQEKRPCISYLMLYFLKGGRNGEDRSVNVDQDSVRLYTMFCKIKNVSVEEQLAFDLESCEMDNEHRLFTYLVPYVLEKFDTVVMSSPALLKVVCAHVDRNQLLSLTCDIFKENITMFRKDSFAQLIASSLEWEPLDQVTLWQFIHAEVVPAEWIFSSIPKLSSTKHADAASNTLMMLRRLNTPNQFLVKALFSKSVKDQFTVNALMVVFDEEDAIPKMATLLLKQVKRMIKEGHIMAKKEQRKELSVEYVFAHLENLRSAHISKPTKKVTSFFEQSDLRELFNEVQSHSSFDQIQSRFGDLLAFIEIATDDRRTPRGGRKTKRRQASAGNTIESDDEERIPRQKKRRVREESDSE
ncbi:hypothetical protein L596_007859 [Steinernema carpocapsae]|uniref:SOSS complex subunit A homolog n=1 Tax=Steinernema carpocapsae TaxID=34508 RepID=A0A4U5PB87_STECR|nr:hypothetical protein L596_007859 [Steinernema carpocapsae]